VKRIIVTISEPPPCHFDSAEELKRYADALKEKEYNKPDADAWRRAIGITQPKKTKGTR
jgi:hypothetical protein